MTNVLLGAISGIALGVIIYFTVMTAIEQIAYCISKGWYEAKSQYAQETVTLAFLQNLVDALKQK